MSAWGWVQPGRAQGCPAGAHTLMTQLPAGPELFPAPVRAQPSLAGGCLQGVGQSRILSPPQPQWRKRKWLWPAVEGAVIGDSGSSRNFGHFEAFQELCLLGGGGLPQQHLQCWGHCALVRWPDCLRRCPFSSVPTQYLAAGSTVPLCVEPRQFLFTLAGVEPGMDTAPALGARFWGNHVPVPIQLCDTHLVCPASFRMKPIKGLRGGGVHHRTRVLQSTGQGVGP